MDGIKFHNNRIGYRFIPKTACTSIKEEIFHLENKCTYDPSLYGMHIHRYLHKYNFGSIDKCQYRFIVVRDPVKRFLSGYSNRILHHNELSEKFISETQPELLTELPAFNPSMSQFIESLNLYRMVNTIDHHFKPFTEYLDSQDLAYFNKVFKIEDTASLASYISEIVSQEVVFPKSQTGGKKISMKELSESQLDFLFEFYHKDYELLQGIYSVDDIWSSWKSVHGYAAVNQKSQKEMVNSMEKPFIIWTMRRTGGTNLGQTLFNASSLNEVQHEPFNVDRVYGKVFHDWKSSKDDEAMYGAIDAILSQKPLIKHCLEIIPDKINEAIVTISKKYGYEHLFLYREFATDRLLSLNYAKMTNIWGREQLSKSKIDKNVFKEPIDIDNLIDHEKSCREKMLLVYKLILKQQNLPLAVSFESLYKSPSFEYSSILVREIFNGLCLDCDNITDNLLEALLKRGGQGTKGDYTRFPNSSTFIETAKKLPLFKLYKNTKSQIQNITNDNLIKKVAIWNPVPSVRHNEYIVSGLVLLKSGKKYKMWLEQDGIKREIKVGLESPKFAKSQNFYEGSNNARFMCSPFKVPSTLKFQLIESDSGELVVFDIDITFDK